MNINLTINGQALSVAAGQTILQAARAHDIYIPTLCDYPGLPPHGSCRMCIVEVQGRALTPTACTTPVEEGMSVQTDTPKVRELRGELLRMLLSDHPGGCLFCPENRHCSECMVTLRKVGVTTGCRSCPADRQCGLQDLIEHSGLESVAYPVRYRGLRVEKEDPFYDRDYNLCILCARCLRACESLHFTSVAATIHRGSEMRIGTGTLDAPSHLAAGCSFCGACVEVCPTGTLMEKTRKWDGRPDGAVLSACPFCSLACEMRLETKNGQVIGALPGGESRMLCVKGRFGVTETVNHPQRLKRVMHIEGGKPLKSSWEEGLRIAARALAECAPQDFAMVVSASCSSEDLFVARKFAREVMGAPGPLLSAAARYGAGLPAVRRLLARSRPLAALDQADLLLCLGLDVKYAQSVVEPYLMRAKARGAGLVTLNAREHVPGRHADLWLKPEPGLESALLARILQGQALSEAETRAAEMLRAAQHPVVVVGPETLAAMPAALESLPDSLELVLLAAEGNLAGALKLGLGTAPYSPAPRVLYLLGAPVPPDLPPDTFVIYHHTHAPDQSADIPAGLLLPAAAFSETGGTLVDQAGRTRRMNPILPPLEDALPGWEILCRLARAMGKSGFEYTSSEQISAEMAAQADEDPAPGSAPEWLTVSGEHTYLGVDLAQWVDGLRELPGFTREEASYVPAD